MDGRYSPGSHTITIVNTGNHNAASSGNNSALDRADVTLAQPSIADGNVPGTGTGQFQYDANWGLTTGVGDMYLGTANWSHTTGATATFRFNGTQVALHAVRDVDQGIMTVSVMGARAGVAHASSRSASGVVDQPGCLPYGHVVGPATAATLRLLIAIGRADITTWRAGRATLR